MKIRVSLFASIIVFALSGLAAEGNKEIIAEGGDPDDRASARVLYWNQKTDSAAGWFAVNYGRPVWKRQYEDTAKFDSMTKGKVWRMGSNYWTVLDTCLPLNIGGKRVPVGTYFLGLHRSADGSTWSLAFIDPATVRRARLDAFQIQRAHVQFEAPMTTAKPDTKAEKLIVTLSYPKDDIKNVTMRVAWGKLALTAPIRVTVPD